MFPHGTSGFSLIELMIGLAIAALLVTLALPSYTLWVADAQIRNGAESIAGGLRFAQGEALKRNLAVEFILDPTAGTGGWMARPVSDTTNILQRASFAEGANKVTFTTAPGAATKITFNGLGFIVGPNNPDGTAPLAEIDVKSGLTGSRQLNVLVGGGPSGTAGQGSKTGVKICDPQANAQFGNNDPKACPI